MKILNLYSGVGGNRKLWKNVEVTAVEKNETIAKVYKDYFSNDKVIVSDAHEYLLKNYYKYDFIWSSPPCQSHSRLRKVNLKCDAKYPEMSLYQEIIFLKNYFRGLWVVENVIPYYEPLIPASIIIGRHLFWTNFKITKIKFEEVNLMAKNSEMIDFLGIDLTNYKLNNRKDQIYRNCVNPKVGEYILNCAIGYEKNDISQQLSLFNNLTNKKSQL